jgi:hypothetical protein
MAIPGLLSLLPLLLLPPPLAAKPIWYMCDLCEVGLLVLAMAALLTPGRRSAGLAAWSSARWSSSSTGQSLMSKAAALLGFKLLLQE